MKTGFAGDEAPRHLERSLVGVCKNKTISRKIHHKEFYSGQDIISKKEILNIKSPVQMVDHSHIEHAVNDFLGRNMKDSPQKLDENNSSKIKQKRISFEKQSLTKKSSLKKSMSKSKSEDKVVLDVPGNVIKTILI